MEITTIPAGPIQTNAYLVADPETREALVIDAPPDALAPVMAAVRAAGYTLREIVLTHHHWDHVVDANALKVATGAPLAAHPDSLPDLRSPHTPVMGAEVAPVEPDRLLNEGDEVTLGTHTFRVLHTPGHAPGQISLYDAEDHVMFGGDTLFQNGYGRVDIPGASVEQTVGTIAKLLALPDEVVVYPGHGPSTTIGAERGWMSAVAGRGRA
ncbi:MAG TPA: MBL fold metallo-hydrolase [Thermomicrobiaceae bacterium]|nr:MBL fold metallo-hydrolase [Thermomicrobiaceae bacterium]